LLYYQGFYPSFQWVHVLAIVVLQVIAFYFVAVLSLSKLTINKIRDSFKLILTANCRYKRIPFFLLAIEVKAGFFVFDYIKVGQNGFYIKKIIDQNSLFITLIILHSFWAIMGSPSFTLLASIFRKINNKIVNPRVLRGKKMK
jgi:hypothetical protein